jgi:hypothetical protein
MSRRRSLNLFYCYSCGADAKARLCLACRKGRAQAARAEARKALQAVKRTRALAAIMSHARPALALVTEYAEAVRAAEFHARRAWTFVLLPATSAPYGGVRIDAEVARMERTPIRKGD